MKYTIVDTEHKYEFIENRKKHSYNGYAFIDESGRCVIIVFGETRRDQMIEYLL